MDRLNWDQLPKWDILHVSHLGYNTPNQLIGYRYTVPTRHNLTLKQTPKADPGSALSLLFKNLHLLGVCYEFTWGQLLGSTLCTECKADPSFFLTTCKPQLCIPNTDNWWDTWSFFCSNFRVCFWNRGLQLLSRHREQTRSLVGSASW